jgi:hypothetical protein
MLLFILAFAYFFGVNGHTDPETLKSYLEIFGDNYDIKFTPCHQISSIQQLITSLKSRVAETESNVHDSIKIYNCVNQKQVLLSYDDGINVSQFLTTELD